MIRRGASLGRARLCGIIALIVAVAVPAAAQAAGTLTFSVRPGHYDPADPATRAYFKRQVAPGQSFADDVIVSNGGSAPLALRVYPVDGLTGQTSGAVYANRGQRRRKAGAWIRTSVSSVVVPAHAEATIHFVGVVPAGTAPGDHLAGIAFQNAHVTTSAGSFRVREILREVVGVLIRVPGPARARLRLGPMALRTLPGTRLGSVVVGIADVGRLLCKPTLSVTLVSPGRRLRLTRRLDTILPGDRIAYPLDPPARAQALGLSHPRQGILRLLDGEKERTCRPRRAARRRCRHAGAGCACRVGRRALRVDSVGRDRTGRARCSRYRRGRGVGRAATPSGAVSARRFVGGVRAAVAAAVLVALISITAPSSTAGTGAWATQTSGVATNLNGADCASTSNCWAVGNSGVIRTTVNGGTSWSAQTSGVGSTLNGISCASTSVCWVVGNGGTILATNNGGSTWSAQTSGVGSTLNEIACPDSSHCFVVGNGGVIRATSNGGTTWTGQTSGVAGTLSAVSCVSASACWATGNSGVILTTSNGGTTWTAQTSGVSTNFSAISCPDSSHCWVAGAGGAIRATVNGGTTWAAQTSGTGSALNGISCAGTSNCWASGAGGTIVVTANGGASWAGQTSGTTNALAAIDCVDLNHCWAAGNSGTIVAYKVSCTGGSLGLAAPGTTTFAAATLNGLNQTVTANSSFTPDDETGSSSGWNITAYATAWSDGHGNTMPAPQVTAASAGIVSGTCTLPTRTVGYPTASLGRHRPPRRRSTTHRPEVEQGRRT